MAGRADARDAALAQVHVHPVVGCGGGGVSHKGAEEDERDGGIGEGVVGGHVGDEGAAEGVLGAHGEEGPEGCGDAEDILAGVVPAL